MIPVSSQRIAQFLAIVALLLGLASVVGTFWTHGAVYDPLWLEVRESYVRLFNVDGEANIPAWYSSSVLLFCSFLLALVASARKQSGDRYVRHWSGLSVIFLCLSIDEAAIIHEMAIKPLQFARSFSGFFYEAWIIPGAAFVLVFVLSYLKFLIHLPRETRRLFLLAGALFVGGAIGVEAVGGQYASRYGRGTVVYELIIVVEELCEMCGSIVFAYSLMEYMRQRLTVVGLQFGDTSPAGIRQHARLAHVKPSATV